MDTALRILLFVAALTVGWAPVARTVHAAAEHGVAVTHSHAVAHSHHHRQSAEPAQDSDTAKAAPLHPGVCAACVGLPAIWTPPTQFPHDVVQEAGPMPALVSVFAAPASPPPRA